MRNARAAAALALVAFAVWFAYSNTTAASAATELEIVLREVRFSGRVDLIDPEERAELEAAVIGRRMSPSDLIALGDRVTLLLHGKGLLLARGYLPPQDVTDGVVEIVIAQGTVGEIAFARSASARVKEEVLQQVLDREIDRAALTRDQVETALLRMSDLPGVSARAWLEPGKEPGTSRLTVQVDQSATASSELSILLRGGAFPTLRRSFDVALIDLSGQGDETRIEGVFSEGARRLSAAWSAPIGTNPSLFGTISYEHSAYEAFEEFPGVDFQGEGSAWSVAVETALLRSVAANVRARAGLTWRGMVEELAGSVLSDKRIAVREVSLSGDRYRGAGSIQWSLTLAGGNVDLSGHPGYEAHDAAGLQTAGDFYRLRGSAAGVRQLGPRSTFAASVSGQWASKNLDSSQQFILGGPEGVRAYPNGEARGDDGAILSFEWRSILASPPEKGRTQVKAFADLGWIRLHKEPGPVAFTNACQCNEYGLAGAGVGLPWTIDNSTVEVILAQAVGQNPGRDELTGTNADGSRDRRSLWVSGTVRF